MVNNIEQTQAWAYDLFIPNELDGDPEFSQDEQIAFWYLLDQYGQPESSELDYLYDEMNEKLQAWHDVLIGTVPRGQVVYLDFSGLKDDYKKNPKNELNFESFQQNVLRELKNIFKNPDGEVLNVEFVTTEPKEDGYTTVVLAGRQEELIFPTRIFQNRSDREKLMVMKWFRGSRCDNEEISEVVEGAIKSVKSKYPQANETEILLKAFDHQEVQSITLGYLSTGHSYDEHCDLDEEFGNQNLNNLISLHYLDWEDRFAYLDQDQTTLDLGYYQYMGYSVEVDGQGVPPSSSGYAESIAHELGHVFGLHHHGRYYYKSCGGEYRSLFLGDVMDGAPDIQFSGNYAVGFNKGAELYLERILGLKEEI